MFVKPSSAFVGWPSRRLRAPPGARRRRGRRGCCRRRGRARTPAPGRRRAASSSPVSVFGLTPRAIPRDSAPPRTTGPSAGRHADVPRRPRLHAARARPVRTPTIVPFADEHLDGAALLLAERHRAHRARRAGPRPARTRQPERRARGDRGARRGRRRVRGRRRPRRRRRRLPRSARRATRAGGRTSGSRRPGHAVAEPSSCATSTRAAAARWVADGLTSHYAIVPATDPALVDAWFRLGFGHQHVHAIREAPPTTARRAPAGRRDPPGRPRRPRRARAARPRASRAPGALARLLALRAADARGGAGRVGRGLRRPALHDVRRRAGRRGRRLRDRAARSRCRRLHRGLALPAGAGFLGFAAVLPEARGAGVGRAARRGRARLGARDERLRWVVTDWRMTNLLSSRAWPRLGFRPTFYRLHRAIA